VKRQALIVVLFVLALRLPFLDQPIQGDDIYYLFGAQHAQIEPLHPRHTTYAFQGDVVSMQGHPHPPGNAWYLGLLLAVFGDVHEMPFHAAYLPFSLIAALSALSIARRFTARPLLATLLFCVVPAFIVNGTSLESDLPLASLLLLSVALFLAERNIAAAFTMAAAALFGYQSIVLIPILFLYRRKPLWIFAVIPLVLGTWELWERLTIGAMPAQVLAGYFNTYGLQRLENKLRNAGALLAHLGWLTFPLAAGIAFRNEWKYAIVPALAAAYFDPHPLYWGSVFVAALILAAAFQAEWLGKWILLFFAAALALFFAGSARYLLPLALPVCILVARRSGWWAVAANAAIGLALAIANYQHWDGYRQLAHSMQTDTREKRVWVNGEWGLRFYLESDGALPLLRGQAILPGQFVVTSALADPVPFTTGGGVPVQTRQVHIQSLVPLRLIGLNSKSAYSSASNGLRPFDIAATPIDIVRVDSVAARRPQLSRLTLASPEAVTQIVSGVHENEGQPWRWMSGRAAFLLKRTEQPSPLELDVYLHPNAPGRHVTVIVDGTTVLEQALPAPGRYTLKTPSIPLASGDAQVVVTIDKTFQAPNDHRHLGLIVASIGFSP
jgi:hypothetical protein